MKMKPSRYPKVVAHRGASAVAEENSLEAFEKAIEIGADMVEFDVRCTADGVYVVYHNPDFHGTPIQEVTYADLAGDARDLSAPPRLEEVLEVCSGRIELDVELKEGGYEADVVRLLLAHVPLPDIVVTSFWEQAVAAIKRLQPGLRTGLLVDYDAEEDAVTAQVQAVSMLERVERCQANLLAARYPLLEPELLEFAGQKQVPIFVWTVNEPAMIECYLRDPRIEAVITDVPDVALRLRNSVVSRPGTW